MANNSKRDIEEMVVERDRFMLIIGLLLAMAIVALTLNIPDGPYPAFDKQCYEACKTMVTKDGVVKSKHFLTTTKYIVEINKCMEACEEAKNENSSKGMAP